MGHPAHGAHRSPHGPRVLSYHRSLVAHSAFVTVGLPVRNGARFIADAIDSVRAQTLVDWRLVVSDNASTDDTVAVVEAKMAGDERISLRRHHRNIGVNANFNATLHGAETPYVKWLAADDRMSPTFLADSVATLEARADCVGAAPAGRLIDAVGAPRAIDAVMDASYDLGRVRDRVHTLLCDDAFVFVLFGVWRREAIGRSRGLGQYVGADKVLLTELLGAGRVAAVPCAAHESRCHPDQSLHLPADVARSWVLGRSTGRFASVVDRAHTLAGYLGAIGRLDLPVRERLELAATFARFLADRDAFARREANRALLRSVASTPVVGEALG
jgi:hypothetical protein